MPGSESHAHQPPTCRSGSWLACSCSPALVAAAAAATHSLSSDVAIAAATAVITVAGLLVAVLQWRAGLAEKALDTLYKRIALANQMRLNVSEGLETDDESEIARERPDDYRFFVFTEIDSLEYAAVRYRFGLGMTDLIADRAVAHFRRRCEESDQFRQTAETCVDRGAYFDDTKNAVTNILASIDAPNQATPPCEKQPKPPPMAER